MGDYNAAIWCSHWLPLIWLHYARCVGPTPLMAACFLRWTFSGLGQNAPVRTFVLFGKILRLPSLQIGACCCSLTLKHNTSIWNLACLVLQNAQQQSQGILLGHHRFPNHRPNNIFVLVSQRSMIILPWLTVLQGRCASSHQRLPQSQVSRLQDFRRS